MDAPAGRGCGRGRGRGQGGDHHHQFTSASFTWTRKNIADALTVCLQVFRGDNDDSFLERNIRKALSKLNATYTFNACPTREVLTTEALRDLLNEYHEKYRRICAIAELPYSGFSSMEYMILMLSSDHEKYVQVWCL